MEPKAFSKVNIKEIYVLVSKFSIFKSTNDDLELPSSVAFSMENFLAVMKDLVFLAITR